MKVSPFIKTIVFALLAGVIVLVWSNYKSLISYNSDIIKKDDSTSIKPSKLVEQFTTPNKQILKQNKSVRRSQNVVEWSNKHFGRLNEGAIHGDYNSYDLDTLEILREQGDRVALDVLAYKYAMMHEDEKSMKAYQESAVYGSTAALVLLSFFKRELADPSVPFSRDREFFTYLQVAYLRGDRESLNTAREYLDNKEVNFTEKDKEYIQQNGERIFNELVHERKKKRLPDFKNDFPDFMLAYNRSVERNSKNLLEGDQAIFVKPL